MDEREREKIFKFQLMVEIDDSRETPRCFLLLCMFLEFDFNTQIFIDTSSKINS